MITFNPSQMKPILSLLTLLLAGVAGAGARTITGTVLADNDSTAIVGAVCHLKSIHTATVTDPDGHFAISTSTTHPDTLAITATGSSPLDIIIPAGSRNIALGTLYLPDAVALRDITVTGQSMIDSRGRTIVYPAASDVKASSTTISLFQKLPLAGLDANPINRTISVDQGTPMILIDGVPASMDQVNALAPGDIERIEYSRITPARYADRGTTGLIAITLRHRSDGGQFYGWARSAVNTAFVDANIRASYHQGPSQFSVSYSPSWRNYQKAYDFTYRSYVGDDFRVDLRETDRNPFNYFSNPLRFKYVFSPSLKTLFSATFNASIDSNSRRYIGSTSDSQLGDYEYFTRAKGNAFIPSLDLFFRHDFNDRNSLEAQVVGTLSSDDYRRTNDYTIPGGDYTMDVNTRRRSLISEISYIHTFSERTSLSAGYQNTVSHSRNTYLTTDYEPILTENNNYLYARLGQQVGKVYISASTGLKMFWVKNDLNRRHFIRNLSTVQGSWNIGHGWNFAAAFQYSPGIPSLSALTDYPQQTTPYLISNGNPDLKVAEYFTYQAMPSFQYKKFQTSLLLSYYTTNNAFIDDVSYLGDRLFLSRSVNASSDRRFDGSLYLKISGLAGFGASLNVMFRHYACAGDGWRHHLNALSGSLYLWWNRGPFTVSYWRKLPGKYLYGQYVGKDENGDALAFEYTPNKHWTLGVNWMYMFDTKGTRYPSWNLSSVSPATTDRYIKNNANMVVLTLSYTADFGSIFRTARRNLNNSDNGSSLLKL